MGLSNQQIERYARQIIVPGVGGIAQERLLSSRLLLAGKAADIAPILSYSAGAGIGEIRLQLPARETPELDALIKRAAQLNPGVVVVPAEKNAAGSDLVFAIGGDSETAELILPSILLCNDTPVIFIHLDEPGSIAMLPGVPPCPLCADAELLVPSNHREDNAGFVAMVAATEAFKLLAKIAPVPTPTLLQFSGFACATRELQQRPLGARCICSTALPRVNNE
jgi:hypothetical protein